MSLNVKDDLNNIYRYLFPDKIGSDSFATYVVNYTLTRPRDVIRMLTLAKNQYKNHHLFDAIAFKNTKLKYSRLFLEDIRNEMAGHVSDDTINEAFTLIRNFRTTFDLKSLKEKKPDYFEQQEGEKKVRELLLLLFQFSVRGLH